MAKHNMDGGGYGLRSVRIIHSVEHTPVLPALRVGAYMRGYVSQLDYDCMVNTVCDEQSARAQVSRHADILSKEVKALRERLFKAEGEAALWKHRYEQLLTAMR